MQTVLVIDDVAPVVHAVRRELKRDYQVIESTTAEDLDRVDVTKLDAAVVDVLMPISGLKVAAAMRARGFTGPLLFISTSPDPALPDQVAQLAPARLLPKPWEPFGVRTALHELLDKKTPRP